MWRPGWLPAANRSKVHLAFLIVPWEVSLAQCGAAHKSQPHHSDTGWRTDLVRSEMLRGWSLLHDATEFEQSELPKSSQARLLIDSANTGLNWNLCIDSVAETRPGHLRATAFPVCPILDHHMFRPHTFQACRHRDLHNSAFFERQLEQGTHHSDLASVQSYHNRFSQQDDSQARVPKVKVWLPSPQADEPYGGPREQAENRKATKAQAIVKTVARTQMNIDWYIVV